jgi:hypothetical protein
LVIPLYLIGRVACPGSWPPVRWVNCTMAIQALGS